MGIERRGRREKMKENASFMILNLSFFSYLRNRGTAVIYKIESENCFCFHLLAFSQELKEGVLNTTASACFFPPLVQPLYTQEGRGGKSLAIQG